MHTSNYQGWWTGEHLPHTGDQALKQAISRVGHPVSLVNFDGQIAVADTGSIRIGDKERHKSDHPSYPLYAHIPALLPEHLGDPVFKAAQGLKYAYIAGAMANGITSVKMVEEMGKAGMIGFFGAAGLSPNDVEAAIDSLMSRMGELPFGFNLIHSPNDPELENTIANLYLRRGIRRVCASAYLDLTLPLVCFRVKGIHRDSDGNIVIPNKIVGKVSRREVARKFLSPAPGKLIAQLIEKKMITQQEAELARAVPMADAITAEADSGGHTDNRPALALLPTMMTLRDEMVAKYRYDRSICVGLGGGIATPESAAAAFAMGADYVLTGSINQACVEAGTSEIVRKMLIEAQQADVTMAAAADMFEMGVKVQVLKRGTMFPQRAAKLYELYSRYDRYEDIPDKQKAMIERDILRCGFEQEWEQTRKFFTRRDPAQVERAEKDPKHKMALVFRSYLGQASRWATRGEPSRKIDYQIWCGPALGAFNEWAKGTFLEKAENRNVVTLAGNESSVRGMCRYPCELASVSGCGAWDWHSDGYWEIFSDGTFGDQEELGMKISQLLDKGVKIPNPASVEIGEEVDIDRISGDGVVIYSGCKIYGKSTLILRGAKLGYEGPATVENCQIGPEVELKGGFFKQAVFLKKAGMGLGAHVREGTILEEEASGAHTVGLKQTILFPYVTLGSLINFCDILMSGGTSRKDHSEVGSSYIHFNYTPNQDKATASLLGDVANGVMLSQRPIFLGGQGGLVGPCVLAFGTVVAAGTICRKDELRPNRLIFEAGVSGNLPFKPGAYRNHKRLMASNTLYIANLIALKQWYSHVRSQFVCPDFPQELMDGLMEKLNMGIAERIKQLGNLFGQQDLSEKWAASEEAFASGTNYEGDVSQRDVFLEKIRLGIRDRGKDHIAVIKTLEPGDANIGTRWLRGITDSIVTKIRMMT